MRPRVCAQAAANSSQNTGSATISCRRRGSQLIVQLVGIAVLGFWSLPRAAAQAPVGGEFQISSFTSGHQTAPMVSHDPSGGFVVSWHAYGQDGSDWGVFGQRFSSDGLPAGGEFQVNSYTSGRQRYAWVSHEPSTGAFVVAWESNGQDGNSYGLLGQRFSSGGLPVAGEFHVNSYTTGPQRSASVSHDSTGSFVVSWHAYGQDGSGWGVFGQRFSSDGLLLAGEFQVNSYTSGGQRFPLVSHYGLGDFVVVWDGFGQDGNSYGVFGQRFSSDGIPLAGEFQINSHTTGYQGRGAVSGSPMEGFLVVWGDSSGEDGSGWGIFGQRFGSDGSPAGGEFQVNSNTNDSQRFPAVSSNTSDGGFVVAWEGTNQDGSGIGVLGRRFGTDGLPVAHDFQVNSYTTADQGSPAVSHDPSGGFVIGWKDSGGSNNGIFGQRWRSIPTLSIAPISADQAEGDVGNLGFTFAVTRTGDTSGTASVGYLVTGSGGNPADANDFGGSLPSGTVDFEATDATEIITVDVSGDTDVEMDEGFAVTLSNAVDATIGTGAADGTIRNDDTLLSIAPDSSDQAEGDAGTTGFTFTVTRTGDISGVSSANYVVAGTGGSPADAADFGGTLPSGTVSFSATDTEETITVDVSGDSDGESDEDFRVTLDSPSGATLGAPTAEGTIRNDDGALSISADAADLDEGDSGTTIFWFTVTRTGDTSVPAMAEYAVSGGSGDPAEASDFGGVFPSGTVSFSIAETEQTIGVDVAGDTAVESDEGFLVTLSNPSRAITIDSATADGTIRNDDTELEVDPGSPVFEACSGAGLRLTVVRRGDLDGAASVDYAVTGLGPNPAAPEDFLGDTYPTGTVEFAEQESEQALDFLVAHDNLDEGDEEFRVTFSDPVGASLATPTVDGVIVDDDNANTIFFACFETGDAMEWE